MLFEEDQITPAKKARALSKLFHSRASRAQEPSPADHVPVEVLAAHGELESHLRYMLDATLDKRPPHAVKLNLRRIEKLLDSLPESILQTLPASPAQDWMRCYRDLAKLHDLLDDAGLCVSVDDYATVIAKMTRLAEAVSEASAVRVTAASMFALWLMQAHLRRYAPRRRRKSRTTKRKRRQTRPARSKPAASPADGTKADASKLTIDH